MDDVISRRELDTLSQQVMKKIGHARSLNSDAAKIRATIFQHRAILAMPFQPGKIFLNLRGINDAAVIIEKKSVLPLTDVQLRYIIGQHAVEPVTRIISRDDELSHVRNIEHADCVSYGLMFIHDATVLHRHEQ